MTGPNDDEFDVSTQSPKVVRAKAKTAVTRVINDPIEKSITADSVANLDEKRDRSKELFKEKCVQTFEECILDCYELDKCGSLVRPAEYTTAGDVIWRVI